MRDVINWWGYIFSWVLERQVKVFPRTALMLSGRAAREYSGAHFKFQRKPERQPQWLKGQQIRNCKFHQRHGTSGHAPQLGVSGGDENAPALRTETYVLHAEAYVQREKLSACTLTKWLVIRPFRADNESGGYRGGRLSNRVMGDSLTVLGG